MDENFMTETYYTSPAKSGGLNMNEAGGEF